MRVISHLMHHCFDRHFCNLRLKFCLRQSVSQSKGDAEIAGLDIAGLNISGRVCESELGNLLRFCYGRPVKTQPTGTRVEKSFENLN